MPRQRVGVALLIPAPVAQEIDALRRAVGDEDVTRIAPHVTLVPPVNVREEEVDDAIGVLRRAAASVRPLRLELGPVTTFSPVSPTLHLAVGGDVDDVRRLRDAVFAPPLERPLTHDFVPHVTLIEGTPHIEAGLVALAGYRAEVVVSAVHLLRETRDADGVRVWRPVADAALGGRPAVIGRGGLELELTTSGVLPPAAAAWLRDRWVDSNVERFGRELPSEIPVNIVGRRDGEIVAAAVGDVRPVTGEAYLAELMVRADLRGGGIGAHLLAAFASRAAELGADHLTLRTEAGGRSQPFYERLGFSTGYVLPAWRHGRDFVQMRKPL